MGVRHVFIVVSFRGGIVRMFAQWRIREDAGKGSAGAGAGSGSAPPPPSGGAFYGGPAYSIDREEAEFAKHVRMLELRARKQAVEDEIARRAPAFGFGGGDSGGVAAVGAVPAGKGGSLPGAGAKGSRGPYKQKVR